MKFKEWLEQRNNTTGEEVVLEMGPLIIENKDLVDPETGKVYKTAAAFKAAQTKRLNKERKK
jgi:hypothetical protein